MSTKHSWFGSTLRRSVARLGPSATASFEILSSLPVEGVRRNIGHGLAYAPGRGRELWRHQAEATEAIRRHLLDPGADPNAIVVMPTGGGKTEIFVRTVEASGLDVGGRRIAVPTIVLEPTRQLVGQTRDVFEDRFPDLHVSALMATWDKPASVTVMTYALFADMVADGRLHPDDVCAIVMDEAHRGLSDMRQDVIGRFLGNTVITAYSATPAFDAIKNVHALLGKANEVCRVSDERLRRDGVIAPVIDYVLRVNITGKLPTDPRMRRAIVRQATANAVINFVSTHDEEISGTPLRDKRYFGYANGVGRAREVAGMLAATGLPAEAASGKDGIDGILEKLGRLASGEIRALVNDQVLVEGTDLPQARGVLAVDATVSLVKHLQRCGRARRIDPSMDRFDPRQTSSIVEVMVELNGVPLQDQRIYAEAIGDLSIARVFNARAQSVDDLVRAVLAMGPDAGSGDEAEDDQEPSLDVAARASDLVPFVPAATAAEGEQFPVTPVAPARAEAPTTEEAEPAFRITEDIHDVHYLLRRREREPRPEEYLTRLLCAEALSIGRGYPGLSRAFDELEEALRSGRDPVIAGLSVRAGLYLCNASMLPCLHVEDLPALRLDLGIPGDVEEKRTGWLNKTQVADNFSMRTNEPEFEAVWQAAASGEIELPEVDGGSSIRLMRQKNGWFTYVHPAAIPTFAERIGRKVKFAFPAKEDCHLSLAQACERIGVGPKNSAVNKLWRRMGEAYARDGAVRDGNRRVDFDIRRAPGGAIGPYLGEAELGWFSRKAGIQSYPPKTDSWLSMNEACKPLSISPYKTPEFRDFWLALADLDARGEPVEGRGRTWRGATLTTSNGKPVFCLHADEIPALAEAFGRGLDKLRTKDWLVLTNVGERLGMDSNRPKPLWRAWEGLLETYRATGTASWQGQPYRFEDRTYVGKTMPCIHVSEVERLGLHLGAQKPTGPKTDEWLSRSELSEVMGTSDLNQTLVDTWKDMVARAEAGTLLDGSRTVRMETRKSTHSYWCLHRDEVPWFSRLSRLPVPVPRAEHHVVTTDLMKLNVFRARREALAELTRGLTELVERGEPPVLPDGRPIRFELTKGRKRFYCLHRDDVAMLHEVVLSGAVAYGGDGPSEENALQLASP